MSVMDDIQTDVDLVGHWTKARHGDGMTRTNCRYYSSALYSRNYDETKGGVIKETMIGRRHTTCVLILHYGQERTSNDAHILGLAMGVLMKNKIPWCPVSFVDPKRMVDHAVNMNALRESLTKSLSSKGFGDPNVHRSAVRGNGHNLVRYIRMLRGEFNCPEVIADDDEGLALTATLAR